MYFVVCTFTTKITHVLPMLDIVYASIIRVLVPSGSSTKERGGTHPAR
jgi:hypothetical protein